MEKVFEIGKFIFAHGQDILGGVSMILMGLIAICMLIPGEQPEKAMKAIVDFIGKFSRKPEAK